jgi:hypothetical protein
MDDASSGVFCSIGQPQPIMDISSNKQRSTILSVGPAVAAIAYPCPLFLFYESARFFHTANHVSDRAIALMTSAFSLSLAYAVPLFAFFAALTIATRIQPTRDTQKALICAHLAATSPPLFTAIGVLCFLIHAPNADYIVWLFLWIPLAVFSARGIRRTVTLNRASADSVRLRMTHGISALLILVVFLAGHMINHFVAIWNLNSDEEVMKALRIIYRADWLEPGLIGLFVFQIVSGLLLLRSRMTKKTDLFGVLQTTSGMYLAAFLVSHMTAVFVLGRLVLKVDTNDAWAAGLPAGLVADLWNTRLIPHYSLAAFLLIAHVGCGLRGILLAHTWSLTNANRMTVAITVLGAVVATVIIVAMLGVHLA